MTAASFLSRLLQPHAPVTRRTISLVLLLAVVVGGVNVLLLQRNAKLQAAAARAARTYVPAPGDTVPDLVGLDLAGTVRTVSYGADTRDTLLFVFSPDCGMSNLAWGEWASLLKAADSTSARLIFANIGRIVPDDHPVRKQALDPGSILEVDARSLVAYNLQVSPQILRITPDRRIADVWVGTLTETEQQALRKALGINATAGAN